MIKSQLVTVAEEVAGTITSSRKDATIGDAFTSLLSLNEAVTGVIGAGQRAGLFLAGMATQSKRQGGSINPFA
jgi:hypothetical protein